MLNPEGAYVADRLSLVSGAQVTLGEAASGRRAGGNVELANVRVEALSSGTACGFGLFACGNVRAEETPAVGVGAWAI